MTQHEPFTLESHYKGSTSLESELQGGLGGEGWTVLKGESVSGGVALKSRCTSQEDSVSFRMEVRESIRSDNSQVKMRSLVQQAVDL